MTTITSIEGNRQRLDGGAMFGNVARPVWEKWIRPDELGRIPLACRALLVESGGVKILCEAGIGAFFGPKLAARYGVETPDRHRLLESLQAKGISPDQVDFVVLSHLHFDHAGGLLPTHSQIREGRKELVFPRAQFLVGEQAWERARVPHARDRASFLPELNDLLERSGRLVRVGQDPLPDKWPGRAEFIFTDGHTPGQMHALFSGDSGKVFFCGDLVPGQAWAHIPITMGYDRFPERLIDEKTALYRRAAEENWLLFFTHDPESAGGRLRLGVDGRYTIDGGQGDFTRYPI